MKSDNHRRLLTVAAVRRLKPDPNGGRREVPDIRARGLHVAIEPSGMLAWGYRFRRPNGRSAIMRLGRVDLSGKESAEEPKVGDPLTLAAARALCADLERQRLRGRDPAAEHQLAKRQARVVYAEKTANTFAAAARQFCDEYKAPKKNRKPKGWRETARYLGLMYLPDGSDDPTMIPHGLAERWRDRPISEITGNDIRNLVDEADRYGIPGMEKRTEGSSDARARKMRDALGSLFGWLLQHRRIVADPALGMWRPPSPAPRHRVLNCKPDKRGADELRWFWSATYAVSEPVGAALRLLLVTGCRLNEVANMRWSELNDDLSVLALPPERVKNGRAFDVLLPPMAREIIRGVRRIEGSDFVFSTNGRTPTGSWSRIKRALDDAMRVEAKKEHGMDVMIEPFVIHDLRRTAASGMASIGVRTEVIERALNHMSGSFRGVAGIYQRDPLSDDVRDALVMWSEHIERIVSGETGKVVPIGSKRRA
jgi:integrase